MMSQINRIFGFLLAGSLAYAGSAFSAPELQTSVVQAETIPVMRVFDGAVEAKYRSTVSAQTAGQVVELPFDVDDVVPAGAIIIRLNDSEQQATLKEAKANLKSAAALQQEAKTEFDRAVNLAQKKLVSQSDLDRAQTQFDATKARYEQAQAQVTIAQKNLDYTVVKAPYSGVVVARHVEIGEAVQIGQPLITGFSLADLRVVTAIPSDVMVKVKSEKMAVVARPDAADMTVKGEAMTIFPYANEQTHNFKVRIDLPANTPDIYPGAMVKVGFVVGQEQSLLAPNSAVARRGEVKGVYVLAEDGQKLSFRYVVTGKPHEDKIEILSGLAPGERIALDPVAAANQLKAAR